mmetsp:Transcript_625/g.1477  ORF Transcript_625/g.1477 Transcript_625/m.1477 type:complete len:91 (+) Transcript_625:1444-1716(+)
MSTITFVRAYPREETPQLCRKKHFGPLSKNAPPASAHWEGWSRAQFMSISSPCTGLQGSKIHESLSLSHGVGSAGLSADCDRLRVVHLPI